MSAGDFFGLVAVITGVLLTVLMLTSAYKRRLDFKQRKLELDAQVSIARHSQAADGRGELLEERVRVLERIVTDKSADLAQQIERLRDEPELRLAQREGEAA